MDNWNDGYFTDNPYAQTYFRNLSPTQLTWTAAVCGGVKVTPCESYFELGFGKGLSLAAHSLCIPGLTAGNDFMPEHVQQCRATLGSTIPETFKVSDCSFADVSKEFEGQKFDITATHGVMSWVSPENTRYIADFARKHVNPGGIFYAAYNCKFGWDGFESIRHALLSIHKDRVHLQPDEERGSVSDALNRLDELLLAEEFKNHPLLDLWQKGIASLRNKDSTYLPHEYLNQYWYNYTFDEMSEILANTKLRFVCDASPAIHLKKMQMGLGKSSKFDEFRFDFKTRRQFRSDIWVKGGVPLTDSQRYDYAANSLYIRNTTLENAKKIAEVKLVVPDIAKGTIETILSTTTPVSGQDIFGQLEEHLSAGQCLGLILVLVGENVMSVCLDESSRNLSRTGTFNLRMAEHALSNSADGHLLSPITGSALTLKNIEIYVIAHVLMGTKPTDENIQATIDSYLKARNLSLQKSKNEVSSRILLDLIPLLQGHQIL